MKKTLVLFVTLFLVNLCVSAQIQRKFFDFTLGETTRSEVEKYILKKNEEMVIDKGDQIMVLNMRFGGQDCKNLLMINTPIITSPKLLMIRSFITKIVIQPRC